MFGSLFRRNAGKHSASQRAAGPAIPRLRAQQHPAEHKGTLGIDWPPLKRGSPAGLHRRNGRPLPAVQGYERFNAVRQACLDGKVRAAVCATTFLNIRCLAKATDNAVIPTGTAG